VILCYITDRSQFPGNQTERLLAKIAEAVAAGVDYIQLREKDLSAKELEQLASKIPKKHLLINSRADVALAVPAGIHLPANDLSPKEVREIWQASCALRTENSKLKIENPRPTISISCHSPQEVKQAAAEGADLAIFAAVFEKKDAQPQGLERLREACQQGIPVLALGGVTIENAKACVQAGAAGIAAIRLFQENNTGDVVAALR
jgi:thiamine-phosphate pyrophosphorylase